jgi:ABC-type transport system substrate-binding protein
MNNSSVLGPYMIDHYTANSEVVLKRNPHYWGKKPATRWRPLRVAQGSRWRRDGEGR